MNQDPNPSKGGISGKLNMAGWRKHYVAALAADEEPWPQREPGSNLGRVFIILLLLHGFLIGAVVLYNVIAPKSTPAVAAGKAVLTRPSSKTIETSASAKVPKAVAIKAAPDKSMPSLAASPSQTKGEVKPVKTAVYEVRSGDNVPAIAAALSVDAEELIRLNNLDNTELYPGRKLSYPVRSAPPVLKAMPIPESLANGAITKPDSSNAVTPSKDRENAPPVKLKDPVVTSADQPPVTKPSRKDESSGGGTARSKTETAPETKPQKSVSKTDKPASSKSESGSKVASKTDSGSKSASKTESNKTAAKSEKAGSRRSHVVGPKETLYSIARKYGVKVDALQKANGIKDPTTLRDGMKLVIPSKD